MRNATIFILVAALAATPAWAQNEGDANTVVANTVTANNVVTANDANAVMPDLNAVAVAPEETTAPATTTYRERPRGFPWGAIGLVGLIGLLGRRRRND
jgi:hypothetical protein